MRAVLGMGLAVKCSEHFGAGGFGFEVDKLDTGKLVVIAVAVAAQYIRCDREV